MKKFLTISDINKLTGLGLNFLYASVNSGKLKSFCPGNGRSIFVRPEDFEEWFYKPYKKKCYYNNNTDLNKNIVPSEKPIKKDEKFKPILDIISPKAEKNVNTNEAKIVRLLEEDLPQIGSYYSSGEVNKFLLINSTIDEMLVHHNDELHRYIKFVNGKNFLSGEYLRKQILKQLPEYEAFYLFVDMSPKYKLRFNNYCWTHYKIRFPFTSRTFCTHSFVVETGATFEQGTRSWARYKKYASLN